ncbi:GTPase-associated system all-helical protein GASH [Shewanella septentrionalis]|uniref:GTPase-associated system helical domain-containing protein n=1 Tax=Shewanella septentrionalis TaxID=2952223 RepID=A0A9X2WY96_9GAMM|nr:hypothetical protein [Shewanella septentrionalis]
MKYTFADRYAEAGLSPTAETIKSRQEPFNRILENVTDAQILELVATYYGSEQFDLEWFRDEFVENDASFSLVGNRREARILAALILDKLIQDANRLAVLAVCTGSVKGLRSVEQCDWLIAEAENALLRLSVTDREYKAVEPKITPLVTQKLQEEINNLVSNPDWQTLAGLLGKMRTEAQSSTKTISNQISQLISQLDTQAEIMREESQMLWWLIGGFSNVLECSFSDLDTDQTAIASAVDLANLTKSTLGPVAISTMLERAISQAKNNKTKQPQAFNAVVAKLNSNQLGSLKINSDTPNWISPVSTAITLATEFGSSDWSNKFQERVGLDSSIILEPKQLAEQLYRECILGRLIE